LISSAPQARVIDEASFLNHYWCEEVRAGRITRGLVAGNGKTPLKAAQEAGNHREDGSTLPRAVAVVQSHLATQWIIQVKLFILAKLFYGSEVAVNAMQCSGSARTAIADSDIAVHFAASRHAGNNEGVPTAVISEVPRDEQIIAIGSARTGIVTGKFPLS
jgi:hypothetical protein